MKAKDRAELTKWLDTRYPPEATPLAESSEYELNRSMEMGCVDARNELWRRLDYKLTRDMLLDVLEEWCDHVEAENERNNQHCIGGNDIGECE